MKTRAVIALALVVVVAGGSYGLANKANAGDDISISIAPQVLVLSSPVPCVTVHSNIPYAAVEAGSVTLEGLMPYLVKPDSCGDLVAKFDIDAVAGIVEPGTVELTLTGEYTAGDSFAASDTITVKE